MKDEVGVGAVEAGVGFGRLVGVLAWVRRTSELINEESRKAGMNEASGASVLFRVMKDREIEAPG